MTGHDPGIGRQITLGDKAYVPCAYGAFVPDTTLSAEHGVGDPAGLSMHVLACEACHAVTLSGPTMSSLPPDPALSDPITLLLAFSSLYPFIPYCGYR